MERRYRCLFTLCVLIGFQVHLPVTMFPANHDGTSEHLADSLIERDAFNYVVGKSQISGFAGRIMRETDTNTEKPAGALNRLIEDNLERNINHKDAHVVEYITLGSHRGARVHEKYDTLIGPHTEEHYQLNGNVNQANRVDLRDFNNRKDLNGLEPTFSANLIKSSKSVISRLPKDLILDIKLEQIQERLANLSTNLFNRKNIFLMDNDQSSTDIGQQSGEDKELKTNNKVDIIDPQKHIKLQYKHSDKDSKYFENKRTNVTINVNREYANGIAWSYDIENRCPQGYSEQDQATWKHIVETNDIVKIEDGCGSMQNRLVTFNDSTKACVRYRMNADLMQGDIYSFYLGKLLGMHYTPPTTMYRVSDSKQWSHVREDVVTSKWLEHKPLILTKWVEDLEPVYMPDELKDNKKTLHPDNYRFQQRPVSELCDLVQWTDLIVFDYISANLDRVVNNMFNLKWNHKMMEKPIHNLEQSKTSGRFVLLDNESGLFHGYRLLETYATYHDTLLASVCVYRQSTVEAVEKLYKAGNAGELLQDIYQANEQLHGFLPRISAKNMRILENRIGNVYKHIQLCKNQFP